MIKERPDWCLSRQRTWGVPIALFVHKQTQELHPRTQEFLEEVAKRVEKDGIEAWFDLDAARVVRCGCGRIREGHRTSWTCGRIPACRMSA